MSKSDYPYANGRIAVKTQQLIGRGQWQRLIEAGEGQALKYLEESAYGGHIDNIHDAPLENLIKGELDELYALLREISPDAELTNILLLFNDAHNLKAITKAHRLDLNFRDYLTDPGVYTWEELIDAVVNKNYAFLSEELQEVLQNAESEENPRLASAYIDKGIYQTMLKWVDRSKNALMREFIKTRIDNANIMMVIRGNQLNWEPGEIEPMFIQGGTIEVNTLMSLLGEPLNQVVQLLGISEHEYHQLVGNLNQNDSIAAIEQFLDNRLLKIAEREKNNAFGIGPILYYYYRRIIEARALRILFAEKRAGMSSTLSALGIVS